VSSPIAGSGAEPQAKSNLLHFSSKIRHLVATVLTIFHKLTLRVVTMSMCHQPGQGGPLFPGPHAMA
jgi:hypothetical protein